jgi:DNA-binding response OmpR family regulator
MSMEPFDQELAKAFDESPPPPGPATILVVGGASSQTIRLIDQLQHRDHRCRHATCTAEARSALAGQPYDLVLIDLGLADGTELMRSLGDANPSTKTIAISEDRSAEAAIRALRNGAIDFVRIPDELDQLGDLVDSALAKSRVDQQREHRLTRLQRICGELNQARQEITDQVDTLCDELLAAYRETSEQLDTLEMATEFRTMLRQELDVEELLRTTLEYLLVKTGPTNAAVFLPDEQEGFDLGAYVNYDCPRDSVQFLLDHLCQAVCPQMVDESDIVLFDDAAEFSEWIGIEADFLAETQIMAFSCEHRGECLAIFVLFRRRDEAFAGSLPPVLDCLRTIFAEQLANVINIHHRAKPSWPTDLHEEDDFEVFGFGD